MKKIRIILMLGNPWFVAKDACDCLEIADVSQACKNLDDDEKQVVARSPELSLLFTESDRAWFSAKQIEECERILRLPDLVNVDIPTEIGAEQTIRDNLKSLGDDGELGLSKIFERRINIEDSCGVPHPTTIYHRAFGSPYGK